jgi:glucokinase
MGLLVAGVDLGGTKTALAIANRQGRILAQTVRPTPPFPPRKAIPGLIQYIETLLASLDSRPSRLWGIGIGVPGLTNHSTGEVLWAPNLWSADGKGWRHVALGRELGRHFRCQVDVRNDVDMALLAEIWKGSAQKLKNAVMATVGTGVGGAFLFDGKILEEAGAVGWIRVKDGECMENIASGPAILRRFLKASKGRWPFEGKPNTLKVCQAALQGHSLARRALREAGEALGWACAGLASILNPEAVIFGGGVMDSAAGVLLPIIRSEIKKLAQPAAARRAKVLHSKLGNRAGWLGAVAAALKISAKR